MGKLPSAPKGLSKASKELWGDIVSEWILDSSQLATLRVGLESLDRLQVAKDVLDREGCMYEHNGMMKLHPAVVLEKQSRAGFYQAIKILGLNLNPPEEAKGHGKQGGRQKCQ